ncbi:2-amino-4-hydroxy-6-hydroxymethyldihydropteridine diphosphokinase [Flavobacterium algicola]|uniref:2-amino-4-hydroxy-6- hydroxymethyldihydropteridine diphosphokinase n=1 Tax=Flavobacterium algicola TaxID=556529 RepID=UPI001EFE414E|nr:2-amino-4-hydroxy-6-hydroxymethyldihydropteridine diphosphokinase [Flavobacterium algicola]MCG9791449.1 2-amino-4-hydroxy-6-hydroxymethyldihydropteridine diphosphokinase [Flavobacterium algicola]
MEDGQKIVLSLGTNQGNKLENILYCIQLIKERIGIVTQVSRVYQTPSWGFESDVFFNCALEVETKNSPHEILTIALSIEEDMGRIRKIQEGYQSRIIDVDLLFYGDEIINTDKLQIPHPLMQDRKFVLLPVSDLNLEWIHPILMQSIGDLIKNCSDSSECIVVQALAFQ